MSVSISGDTGISKVQDGVITAANLEAGSVTTAKIADANVTVAKLSATGTPSASTFLSGDGSWQTVPTPTIASTAEAQAGTNNTNFITPLRMREGFNASGSAPVYACRAWVNFNGTGTVAIRASGNVSSITDNGTGVYTINFATAMQDTNYNMVGGTGPNTNARLIVVCEAIDLASALRTTTQLKVMTGASGSSTDVGVLLDPITVSVSIFR